MLNRLQIIGNVGHTPEVKTVNGAKVANIQVGVTEKGYTTKEGTKVEDRTDWFYVVAWRGLAEVIEKFVGKGDKLYIDGRMKSRQYEKDGVKKTAWELYADNIELLTPKKDGQAAQSAPAQPAEQSIEQKDDDSQLPF